MQKPDINTTVAWMEIIIDLMPKWTKSELTSPLLEKAQFARIQHCYSNEQKQLPWVQNMPDVIQRGVINFITIGEAINLLCLKVDKHMVTRFQTVCVGMRLKASPLKILPTNQTGVHIQI